MDPITITVTGVLRKDPRTFTTQRGTPGVSLWLETSVPARGTSMEAAARYMDIVAFGTLANHVAESMRANDRVTVRANDVQARAWLPAADEQGEDTAKIRSCVKLVAWDIAASLVYDSVTTGAAGRRAAQAAAANGEPSGLPHGEQADLAVLAGVTAERD